MKLMDIFLSLLEGMVLGELVAMLIAIAMKFWG